MVIFLSQTESTPNNFLEKKPWLWLFHLVCIWYFGCFNLFCNVWVCMCGLCNVWVCMCGFCNVWVCVCVGFVMCRRFDNCVDFLVICILVFAVFVLFVLSYFNRFLYICIHILFCFVCISVRTTSIEWRLNSSNNNNNNTGYNLPGSMSKKRPLSEFWSAEGSISILMVWTGVYLVPDVVR